MDTAASLFETITNSVPGWHLQHLVVLRATNSLNMTEAWSTHQMTLTAINADARDRVFTSCRQMQACIGARKQQMEEPGRLRSMKVREVTVVHRTGGRHPALVRRRGTPDRGPSRGGLTIRPCDTAMPVYGWPVFWP
jgi:hypothetical protein